MNWKKFLKPKKWKVIVAAAFFFLSQLPTLFLLYLWFGSLSPLLTTFTWATLLPYLLILFPSYLLSSCIISLKSSNLNKYLKVIGITVIVILTPFFLFFVQQSFAELCIGPGGSFTCVPSPHQWNGMKIEWVRRVSAGPARCSGMKIKINAQRKINLSSISLRVEGKSRNFGIAKVREKGRPNCSPRKRVVLVSKGLGCKVKKAERRIPTKTGRIEKGETVSVPKENPDVIEVEAKPLSPAKAKRSTYKAFIKNPKVQDVVVSLALQSFNPKNCS